MYVRQYAFIHILRSYIQHDKSALINIFTHSFLFSGFIVSCRCLMMMCRLMWMTFIKSLQPIQHIASLFAQYVACAWLVKKGLHSCLLNGRRLVLNNSSYLLKQFASSLVKRGNNNKMRESSYTQSNYVRSGFLVYTYKHALYGAVLFKNMREYGKKKAYSSACARHYFYIIMFSAVWWDFLKEEVETATFRTCNWANDAI